MWVRLPPSPPDLRDRGYRARFCPHPLAQRVKSAESAVVVSLALAKSAKRGRRLGSYFGRILIVIVLEIRCANTGLGCVSMELPWRILKEAVNR